MDETFLLQGITARWRFEDLYVTETIQNVLMCQCQNDSSGTTTTTAHHFPSDHHTLQVTVLAKTITSIKFQTLYRSQHEIFPQAPARHLTQHIPRNLVSGRCPIRTPAGTSVILTGSHEVNASTIHQVAHQLLATRS